MITALQARNTVVANIKRQEDDLERCSDEINKNINDNMFSASVQFDSKTNANTVKKKLEELGYRVTISQNAFYPPTPSFTMEIYW